MLIVINFFCIKGILWFVSIEKVIFMSIEKVIFIKHFFFNYYFHANNNIYKFVDKSPE